MFYPSQEATQSVIAAVEWMAREKGKTFFLVGSDYIYPRTCNKIAKPAIAHMGAKVVGCLLYTSPACSAVAAPNGAKKPCIPA